MTAAVVEIDGRFLVTRRQKGAHLEGFWEFPGGKCDAGESHADGLIREMREELGVNVTVGKELLTTTHVYPDRSVELHFLHCDLLGVPTPLVGQEMRWVPRHDLASLAFPPADDELIRLLTRSTVHGA